MKTKHAFKFTDDKNQPCDEMRYLPYSSDGNILVGYRSYCEEIRWRKERIAAGVSFDLPSWNELKVYGAE